MTKPRRQVRPSEKAGESQGRQWIQIAIIAVVVLLAAALLLLKDRPAAPVELDLGEPQAAAGGQGQADAGAQTLAGKPLQVDTPTAVPDELAQDRLERLLSGGQPTLAFFHSNNCIQCQKMMEIVADVYPEYEDSVALVDVNVYDPANRTLLQQARIHAIPTQIFFNAAGEGELVVGAIEPEAFRTYMRTAAGIE